MSGFLVIFRKNLITLHSLMSLCPFEALKLVIFVYLSRQILHKIYIKIWYLNCLSFYQFEFHTRKIVPLLKALGAFIRADNFYFERLNFTPSAVPQGFSLLDSNFSLPWGRFAPWELLTPLKALRSLRAIFSLRWGCFHSLRAVLFLRRGCFCSSRAMFHSIEGAELFESSFSLCWGCFRF